MAMATLRLPQRQTLVLALAVFCLGHVVAALSTSFTVVLAARVVTALATGAFWAVGFVVATAAAGPRNATRATGVMMGGLTLANVVGVPIGSFAGQFIGWRGPFWALAVLAGARRRVHRPLHPRGRSSAPRCRCAPRSGALRQGRLWLALSAAMLIMGGVLATYTYVTPLLTDRAGIPAGAVPLVLIAFGVGALGGTAIGGRLGDRRPMATTITAAAATALVLLLLIPLSTQPGTATVPGLPHGPDRFHGQPGRHLARHALRRRRPHPHLRADHLRLQHRHRRRLAHRRHAPWTPPSA